MAYIEPTQVVTGQPITAAKWNQDVVDNTLALYNTPGVILNQEGGGVTNGIGTQSALIGENTQIDFLTSAPFFNSEITVDTDNNTLIVQQAGVYAVFAYVLTATTTSANNGSLFIQSNDGQFLASRAYQHPAIGGGYTADLNVLGIKKFAVGDYVQFYFRQNLIASLLFEPWTIGMHWIGSGI